MKLPKMEFCSQIQFSYTFYLQETPPQVFVICLKAKRFSAFLIWCGRSFGKFDLCLTIFMIWCCLAQNCLWIVFGSQTLDMKKWVKRLQWRTKYLKQSEEIKQIRTGIERFDICLCVICDWYRQSFIPGRQGTKLCLHLFLRVFKHFLIS